MALCEVKNCPNEAAILREIRGVRWAACREHDVAARQEEDLNLSTPRAERDHYRDRLDQALADLNALRARVEEEVEWLWELAKKAKGYSAMPERKYLAERDRLRSETYDYCADHLAALLDNFTQQEGHGLSGAAEPVEHDAGEPPSPESGPAESVSPEET